jgi:hypothetical protein
MDTKERKATRERLDLNLITLRHRIEEWQKRTRPLSPAQIEAFVRPLIGTLASVDVLRPRPRSPIL